LRLLGESVEQLPQVICSAELRQDIWQDWDASEPTLNMPVKKKSAAKRWGRAAATARWLLLNARADWLDIWDHIADDSLIEQHLIDAGRISD